MTFKQDLRQLLKKHLDGAAQPREWMLVAIALYNASNEVDDEADRRFTPEQWAADLEGLEAILRTVESRWRTDA